MTDPTTYAAVDALIAKLCLAFPGFSLTDKAQDFWCEELSSYTPVQLAKAARDVMRYHAYGPPSLAVVFQALEGRVIRKQVDVTNEEGSILLDSSGAPRTRWVDVRVDLAGREMDEVPEDRQLQDGPLSEEAAALLSSMSAKKPKEDILYSDDALGLLEFRRRTKWSIGTREERRLCMQRLGWSESRYLHAADEVCREKPSGAGGGPVPLMG